MDVHLPTPLLGGLSPQAFMRRHWHKRPLLVRQAWPGVTPPLLRPALFALAGRDEVESRLVERLAGADGSQAAHWRVRHGPFTRRSLPPLQRPGWTLLVQGLDLHVPSAHTMLAPFAFIPGARLDDLMVSWASDGGGVGPHLDSYDVFLLQVQGRRRWRIGPLAGTAGRAGRAEPGDSTDGVDRLDEGEGTDGAWVEGAPLKILRRFQPAQEWLLEPGDMLYLPPGWAHEGVAEGECMTVSVGFRAPARDALAAELLQRLADSDDGGDVGGDDAHRDGHTGGGVLYRDPRQGATAHPGAMPQSLQDFAQRAVQRLLSRPQAVQRALGEVLTEPKPRVWFEAVDDTGALPGQALRLAAATRMLYDSHHVFINGESYRASGRDARLMQQLADTRQLPAAALARLSPGALELVSDWLACGWLQGEEAP